MRRSTAAWRDCRYEPATGADGYEHDANAARRAQVLWALQYDRRAGDLPLLRWLAGQEAECRGQAPFQGLTEETELAGFLLAEHRQADDVWLHWAIKTANFDTWCGYDVEHLFAAGVQPSVAAVRDSDDPERDAVMERLLDTGGEPCVSDEDVAGWFAHLRSRFPADPADEDPITWVERAKLVGDPVLARHWLDRWAAGRERDPHTLGQLRHQLADLGAFAEAAAAQRESLTFAADASAWRTLAGLERRAGHHDAAWAALRECRRALDDVAGWRTVGLGRMYVEELFLLAGVSAGALAGAAFAEADRVAGQVPGLALVVLRAAVEAADNVGEEDRARHYRYLRDIEQQRIDTELRELRS
ncbi:hypothetical protein AB0J72_06740 [Dactylosporangium sp. NPDC049742]|uniref:hypothetical protein n=1 Tax=Dactylosporangium sp. NPDC049742 TaxID=3154737 RepID=UPI00341BBA3A